MRAQIIIINEKYLEAKYVSGLSKSVVRAKYFILYVCRKLRATNRSRNNAIKKSPCHTTIGPNKETVGLVKATIEPNKETVGLVIATIGPNKETVGLVIATIGPNKETVGLVKATIGPNKETVGLVIATIGPNNDTVGFAIAANRSKKVIVRCVIAILSLRKL